MRKQITYVFLTVLFLLGTIFTTQANYSEYDGGIKVVVVVIGLTGEQQQYEFKVPKSFIGENGKLVSNAKVSILDSNQLLGAIETTESYNVLKVKSLEDIKVVFEFGTYYKDFQ